MSTLEIALAEINTLKMRVDALEKGGGAKSAPSPGGGGGEALPDHMLDGNDWALKTVAKDPKQWKGRSQVGRTYAQAPVEWLEMMAKNMDYKAQCGREENPVRLKNNGKPWHESDTFEAKLLRAWARRNASKPKPAPEPEKDGGGGGWEGSTGADDSIPFLLNMTLTGQWERP